MCEMECKLIKAIKCKVFIVKNKFPYLNLSQVKLRKRRKSTSQIITQIAGVILDNR